MSEPTILTIATELKFFVPGTPISQGSMVCMGVGRAKGLHRVVPSNQVKLLAWRALVTATARNMAVCINWHPLDCAEVRLLFRLTRPASHYRTGRYAHLLRDDAPTYPTVKPDWDKLGRAISDSLTDAAVISDDAVIVTGTIAKRYCHGDQRPGVNVVLNRPAAPQATLALGVGAW